MKAILEFNLPEDGDYHKHAINGGKYFFVIQGMLQEIRKRLKYHELTPETEKALEELRDFIYEELKEENIC